MDDTLRKLGLRVRPRKVASEVADKDKPGEIKYDARGNAIYEWKDARFRDPTEDGERAREKALEHPGLSLMDEEPPANVPIRSNPKGLRQGYNPYESGVLAKKDRKKKTDLRELSKWIEQKKAQDKKDKGE